LVTVEKEVFEWDTRLIWVLSVERAKVGDELPFHVRLEYWTPEFGWMKPTGALVNLHILRPDGLKELLAAVTGTDGVAEFSVYFDIAGSWEIWARFEGQWFNERVYLRPSESTHLF